MIRRDEKLVPAFKALRASEGNDCCEVCRWRPPLALRDVAGGRIDRLLQAHHIVPIACGGLDAMENLILLCPNHHTIAHYMGRMGPKHEDRPRRWDGPHTRSDFMFAVAMLRNREEYRRFAKWGHDRVRYLETLEEEAAAQDVIENIRINRTFTVIRGRRARVWGTRA